VWLDIGILWNRMPGWLWKLRKQQRSFKYCAKQHQGLFRHIKGFVRRFITVCDRIRLRKKVPYKVSSDAAYSQLAQPYNLRLPYKPAVIVLPTTNQHVQDAVVCGAKGGLKIQAKSGGHSYASYSSGGKDGSMGKLTCWNRSRG
jgi:hypothetical protein